MIYPDGRPRTVLMAEPPMDGDWRADADFYDEVEQAYKKRLRRALNRDKPILAEEEHCHSGSAFLFACYCIKLLHFWQNINTHAHIKL